MNSTKTAVHQKTPTVTVLNNRGHVIRDIAYHRHPDSPDKTDERITRHQYDARGFLQQSADPRLSDAKLANFRYLTSLSGQVLRTESCDAGTSLALSDVAGRPVIAISQISTDQNGKDDLTCSVTHTFQYESGSAGRPLSITEQLTGHNALITERFIYGNSSQAAKDKNLAGVCTHHYDPAGLTQTESLALTGVPLSVTRQLLKEADNPDLSVNWPENNPDALLSAEKYTTQTIADATGEVLITTDSAGHQQKVTYDVAGLLRTSRIILKNGTEKTIIKSVNYSAAGQKLREEHGNGVVTTYTYEAQTQRLIAIKTEHPAKKNVLQDLRYEYDPVGNVLCVTNNAEETRFWHNQKVVPENRYVYDSLYQLVSATGREMANAGQQNSSLPDISPFDKATYTNYTRHYSYDRAGNMTQIRHSAPSTNNNYTTEITVSNRSNHAVLKTLADTPDKVDALFTPGGQQIQLMPGQTLAWTARAELRKVTPVTRTGAAGDSEHYRYGAGSQRLLKVSVQKTGNGTQTQRVVYLPGLELRAGAENYQVICAGESGRAQVRLLHWVDGSKADQLRFSYDNLIGSNGLETDSDGNLLSQEEYYPYGGTAVLVARPDAGIDYKTHRYSGKERDATGLYYYGYRYYQPWAGRWLSSDPAGTVDGLNLFRMVRNNPVTLRDDDGLAPVTKRTHGTLASEGEALGKIIGTKISKLNKNVAQAWTKKIKDKNDHLMSVFSGAGLPVHKESAVSEAFNYAISGNKDKFASRYRAANPAQDELMSTQTVFSVYKGIGMSLPFTPEQEDLARESLKQLSLTRLPTSFSGYHYQEQNMAEIMQHPTAKSEALYSSPGAYHGIADVQRRAEVIDVLSSELNNIQDDDVIDSLLKANLKAAEYTLGNFTAPANAENMILVKTLTSTQMKDITMQREAIKHLDEPNSSYRKSDSSWKKDRNKRGFSPFRQ